MNFRFSTIRTATKYDYHDDYYDSQFSLVASAQWPSLPIFRIYMVIFAVVLLEGTGRDVSHLRLWCMLGDSNRPTMNGPWITLILCEGISQLLLILVRICCLGFAQETKNVRHQVKTASNHQRTTIRNATGPIDRGRGVLVKCLDLLDSGD